MLIATHLGSSYLFIGAYLDCSAETPQRVAGRHVVSKDGVNVSGIAFSAQSSKAPGR